MKKVRVYLLKILESKGGTKDNSSEPIGLNKLAAFVQKTNKDAIIPFIDGSRRKMFDVLMKLLSDMLFFMLSKPTINDIWWNMNEIFTSTISFIKNIAEGNFIEFKLFMGTYKFSSQQDPSFNKEKLSMSEFFTSQMLYILNWSLVCENQESKLVSTDQHERIFANLQPILSLLTEVTTGPCKLNQQAILSVRYTIDEFI